MIGTHFSGLDWAIVITYLAATLATGLYGRRFVGGIADFLVAGRELGLYLAVATLLLPRSALSRSCITPSSATRPDTRHSSTG